MMLTQRMLLDDKQSKCKTAQEYVKVLKDHCHSIHSKELYALIKSLRVELTCKEVSWVRDFGANKGHEHLFNILHQCSQASNQAKISTDKKLQELHFNIIMCINSFMNNQVWN